MPCRFRSCCQTGLTRMSSTVQLLQDEVGWNKLDPVFLAGLKRSHWEIDQIPGRKRSGGVLDTTSWFVFTFQESLFPARQYYSSPSSVPRILICSRGGLRCHHGWHAETQREICKNKEAGTGLIGLSFFIFFVISWLTSLLVSRMALSQN